MQCDKAQNAFDLGTIVIKGISVNVLYSYSYNDATNMIR